MNKLKKLVLRLALALVLTTSSVLGTQNTASALSMPGCGDGWPVFNGYTVYCNSYTMYTGIGWRIIDAYRAKVVCRWWTGGEFYSYGPYVRPFQTSTATCPFGSSYVTAYQQTRFK